MQLGCSKLSKSTLNRTFLNNRQTSWTEDQDDFNSRYKVAPDARTNSGSMKDSARFVDVEDSAEGVTLTATQPAPSINSATAQGNPQTAIDCAHGAECDCQKPKMKPRLPFAEPIDPPPVTTLTPPKGLVSQPLAPILFDKKTREVQMDVVFDTQNSLRRNERWSHEKVATLNDKPEPNQISSEISPVQASQIDIPQMNSAPIEIDTLTVEMKPDARRHDWSDLAQTEMTAQVAASSLCPTCKGQDCDGSCSLTTRRSGARNLQPVVKPEPVVIVATTSPDTIPPFAEAPADDQVEALVEKRDEFLDVELAVSEPGFVAEPEPESESFDDMTDDDWLAMFGPLDQLGPGCPACQSSQCSDPNCGQSEPVQSVQVELSNAPNDFAANDFAPNELAPEVGEPNPDAEHVPAPANNDFLPASHSAEVASGSSNNDFVADAPAVETVAEFKPQDAPIQTSHWDPADFEPNEVVPANFESETDRSPQFELEIELPEMPAKSSQPRPYTGPAVRFEIIDNTVPWNEKLAETILNVQARIAVEDEPETRNGLEVNLRLLEVLQRQMADVDEHKDSLSDQERQYWQHQLDAIALMLDSNDGLAADGDSDLARHQTAINTLEHLRKAVERLESIANLQINNGAFCTEVSGFGQFKPFSSTMFQPDQRMLVYCEVENYTSMQREINLQTEVHTRLRGSYVIYDQQGRAVQQSEYPNVEDIARKRRRDFYMYFPIQLENLKPGQYKLQLMVEDLNGRKTASLEPALEFKVE
jgi:hypothetical protein